MQEDEDDFGWFDWARGALLLSSTVVAVVGTLVLSSGYFSSKPANDQSTLVLSQWSRKVERLEKRAKESYDQATIQPTKGPSRVASTLVSRIRDVSRVLDTCQQDIYDETWYGLQTYPGTLRATIPLISAYTDIAYPAKSGDKQTEILREALQFEVGRFATGVELFEKGAKERAVRDCERAFADMSLAYDRILKAGNLYAGYDPVTSTTVFYDNIDDSRLGYTPLSLGQPHIRDEVLVIKGPDKGRLGRVIWLGRNEGSDKVVTATVKMDSNPLLAGSSNWSVREVKSYPYDWIAMTRTSEQSFLLELGLGGLAAVLAVVVTYPIDTVKSRLQSGMSPLPESGLPGVYKGLTFNILREVPNQAIYLACFNSLTTKILTLPFLDANNPSLKLLVMIPAGALGFLAGTPIRAPFEVLNKQIQAGMAKSNDEAIRNVFFKPSRAEVWGSMQKTWILTAFKGIWMGALNLTLYEIFKDNLELIQYGVPVGAQPLAWGFLAGAITGAASNPPDVILTVVAAAETAQQPSEGAAPGDDGPPQEDVLGEIALATRKVWEEEGPAGFFAGASERALYIGLEACVWLWAYEGLTDLAQKIAET